MRHNSSPARRTQPLRTAADFRGSRKGSHHVRPHGSSSSPGEPVRQTGIYEVAHDKQHREPHEVVMLAGDAFPPCDTCEERVRFRLLRTAPYIFQDEDFEESGE